MSKRLVAFVAVREAGVVADALELPAHAAGGGRPVADIVDDAGYDRNDRGKSRANESDRSLLTDGAIEFVRKEQTNPEAHGHLRKGDDSRDGQVVAKFFK